MEPSAATTAAAVSSSTAPGRVNLNVRGRRLLTGAIVVLAATGTAGAAALEGSASAPTRDVPRSEAVVLIREAASDPAALEDLRTVDQIDGRPVDLTAVTDATVEDRRVRLTELADQLDGATDSGAAVSSSDDARRSAEQVLDAKKYHGNRLPQPFRGPLRWMADRLSGIGDFFAPIFDSGWVQLLLFFGVLVGAGFGAVRLISRRSRAAVRRSRGGGPLVDQTLDPAELDRQADKAADAGDHQAAVRLRYEAGLLRLARSGRLDLRIATTARGAAHQVDQPAMDRLTDDFERVVYGG
ncbi:MAG: hypothetical protein ABI239_09865, partial [Aquihabitans sp.]